MKKFHVVLLNYKSRASLERAIHSVQNVPSCLGMTILGKEPLLQTVRKATPPPNELPIINDDIGITLNQLIKNVNTDYVLFLYNEDYIIDPEKLTEKCNKDLDVLTYPHNTQNTTIQRPLIIKTSLLRAIPLLKATQVPFPDAIFSLWLTQLKQKKIVHLSDGYINQHRKTKNVDTFQKNMYLRKLQLIHRKQNQLDHPSLSILLSTYNMESYIETALFSCLHQIEPAAKILVIDDGSTDSTYSRLKRWEEADKIQLFHAKNGGKARALNLLLPHVATDFILELDADDWLDPDAISTISDHLESLPPNCAVLYGNLRYWRTDTNKNVQFKGVKKGMPVVNEKDLMTYRFPLGPRIYRTSALNEIKGFPVIDFQDGRLFEDVSVLKALIKSYSFSYKNFAVYNVREHEKSITKNNHSKWSDYLKSLD